MEILGSTDGTTYTTLAPATAYTFDSTTANTVTIPTTSATNRYVQVKVTNNSAWPAAQIAEFEIYK